MSSVADDYRILGRNDFGIGYRVQHQWRWLIATAFFFGKVGGGLYFVGQLADVQVASLIGLVVLGVGKGTAHLLYLGRPLRFWRALARPDRSWISRGIWGMALLLLFGTLTLAPEYPWLGWIGVSKGSSAWQVFYYLAIASSLLVMVYDGFLMKACRSIPLWSTWLMPLLCLSYASLGGATLVIVLGSTLHGEVPAARAIELLEWALFGATGVLILLYARTMLLNADSAGRKAIRRILFEDRLASSLFWIVGVGLGLVGCAILSVYFAMTGNVTALVLLALAELAGDYVVFYQLLTRGLFSPQFPPSAAGWASSSAGRVPTSLSATP